MKVFTILLLVAAAASAQPATAKEKILAEWTEVARKINSLAAEFPEDKYDYRPAAQVRTFAQQMLHLAFWNQYVERAARGEKPDGKLNELPRSGYKTKADVVKVLRSSFDGVIAGVKSMPEAEVIKHLDLWTAFLIHSGEHYGQSVIYYRLNGLVPPESRK